MCCPDGRAKRHNRIDREQVGHGVWQIGVRHSLPIWVSWLQPPKRMRLARQSATAQTACLRALVGLTLKMRVRNTPSSVLLMLASIRCETEMQMVFLLYMFMLSALFALQTSSWGGFLAYEYLHNGDGSSSR